MSNGKGGFIGQDGLNAPDPATGVTGTAGDAQVTVSWTAPSDVGGAAITGYSVQSNNGDGTYNSSYDLSSASYDGVSFDVSSQETAPYGLTFNNDGTKLYVTGQGTDTVYQYSLSTAFDLDTTSYDSVSFNANSQNTAIAGVAFNNDGTKMYLVGYSSPSSVFQYSLSTAFDLSTASYDSVSFNVSSQASTAFGLAFNNAGTKMYIVSFGNDTIYQYSLSSAFNLSTASYDSVSLSVNAQEAAPAGMTFNNDGTKMYIVGENGDEVNQYGLSTAFDLSTASYDNIAFSLSSQDSTPADIAFNNDGTKMYMVGYNTDAVYQYSTGIAAGEYPTASPITVTGLTNGTSYTFNVWAINAFGWSSPSDASGSVSPNIGDRGLIAGGRSSSGLDVSITYITISTSGSDADFGDLSTTTGSGTGLGSSTRGVIFVDKGSTDPTASPIEYVTFATKGDTTDFGDLAVMSGRRTTATSNETRGLFMGQFGDTNTGGGGFANQNAIAYITIASAGNATDFGDLTRGTSDSTNGANAACSSTTRAILGGGGASTPESNILDYVTISSTGNATDFGDLTIGMNNNMSCSSNTRGIWAAGLSSGNYNNTINYVTIASTGNAADFGDMTLKVYQAANGNLSNKIYGMFAGGNSDVGDYRQQISYITIASTGNTSDFGDLSTGKSGTGAASNAHGGLS